MVMKGQKRKCLSDREDAGGAGQRQSVWYISLDKHQRGQKLREPSLRRSVLIANTLRQITLEISEPRSPDADPPSPWDWECHEGDRVSDSSVEVMRSSDLGDLTADDLFHDIDTSLLEREMCLPSFSSFSPSSSPSLCSPFSGQSHLRDMHDLEHLMEILVEA